MRHSVVSILYVLVLACVVVAPVASAADQVENPAYKGWKNFKVGSWSRLQGTMQSAAVPPGGNQATMTMVHKLVELTAEKAVIETTVTISMAGREIARPGQRHDVPAMVDADKADFGAVSDNPQMRDAKTDVKKGEEEIDVLGKKIKCNWVDITVTKPERTINVKVWHTLDIPGGMVQSETKSAQMSNTLKLTEFEIAK
ncbi:MAG: hypothetical protein ABSH20_01290 [Tepidisphaeraceae bacterium]